ncbi:MAG: M17 family metallopeptidase [Rhizobiaceae bacterium]
MPVTIVEGPSSVSRPIHVVARGGLSAAGLDPMAIFWAEANGFDGEPGRVLVLPGNGGVVAGALFGAPRDDDGFGALAFGALSRALPEGDWHVASHLADPTNALVGVLLGSYVFSRYGKKSSRTLQLDLPQGADGARARRIADGVILARDLINTPANDMGPEALERSVRELADGYGAAVTTIAGDELLSSNLPMIHAVGRASIQAPRLVDMRWGRADAPKVTLVGKGVCFDTGGLDIKPASNMLLMKKDMGGAASVLGLASMLMAAKLDIHLRVLVPAVENSIGGSAFRPGDVLPSRKGMTVEIGNTDAEGRLILADALALADEEAPRILIDIATLTGAARVALGPDLPPYFTPDDALAAELDASAAAACDPLWRLPLWKPYDTKLSSKVADVNNVTTDGFAGAVTAALFLKRFVEKTSAWVHFDIFGWSPGDRPHCLAGGEAQAIRALEHLFHRRFA